MKQISMISLFLFFSLNASADVMKDFDSLGGNNVLLEKVKAIEPQKKTNIVQNRIVGRTKRVELAPEFTTVLGGEAYTNTAGVGIVGQFHFNPYFSLGARWNRFSNTFSPEGKNLIDESAVTGKNTVPDVDPALNQTLAVANFYPIYGKLNLFNKAVTHFDVYGTVGYGTINLKSGAVSTWTGGAGIGFWFTQHLSTRMELFYQTYEAKRLSGAAQMNLTNMNLQVGYLL